MRRQHDLDAGLAARALRERWPISDEQRKQLIESMVDLASSPLVKPSTRVLAFRAIVDADKVDVEAAKTLVTAAAVAKMPGQSVEQQSPVQLASAVTALLGPPEPETVEPFVGDAAEEMDERGWDDDVVAG